MIIFKKKHNYLINILIILCLCYIFSSYHKENKIIKTERKNNSTQQKIMQNDLKQTNTTIEQLIIPSIDFDKMLLKTPVERMQKEIDLNNIVTNNDFKDQRIIIYGHYTKTKNLVFNRIYDLAINDRLQLRNVNGTREYAVSEMGKLTDKVKLDDLSTQKQLIIVTCGKNLENDEKYYIKARLI